MELHQKQKPVLVDYIFWFIFILFTNPGGILKIFGEGAGDGGIKLSDLLYAIMVLCFVIVYKKNKIDYDQAYKKTIRYIFIFSIYYLLVFSFVIPIFKSSASYSPIVTLIKIRHSFVNISLIFLVYNFYLRSYKVFFKVFLYSSIIVIGLYVVSIFTGLDIIPIRTMDRKFIATKRLLMVDYGLMPILISMGIVAIIFKFEIKYRKIILIAAGFMFLAWLLAIYRRHIFGSVITLFIAIFLYNFICRKALISMSKLAGITVYTLIFLVIIQFTFPQYIDAGIEATKETIHVMQYGESTTGKKDVRFGSGKDFMKEMINQNYMVGTGFDNRWRSKEGDSAGYEASDYPFLGAIAMYGILGMLIFLPLYVVLYKTLKYDIIYLRKFGFNVKSFDHFVMIFFIIYFIYDFMQYMNWFLPISIINDKKWYAFFGMYLASRRIFYNNPASAAKPVSYFNK